jgi:methylaspartate ammonia-lyase
LAGCATACLSCARDDSYNPILHIDVYGTIGAAFGNDNYKGMADYIADA